MDFLQQTTHRSPEWWVQTIQELVKAANSPSDDPNHDAADPRAWLKRLADLVVDGLPVTGEPYDGNMRAAAIAGMALLTWQVRLHRAKWSDPRRPLEARQRSYEQWLAYCRSVSDVLLDIRQDPVSFSGQEWDHPFSAHARSGSFV